MTTVVLQGESLTAGAAGTIAHTLHGTAEACGGYWRIKTPTTAGAQILEQLRVRHAFDINALPLDFDPAQARLLITDMDSTLINIECVDEIADYMGVKPQVAAITEAAMRGELDFEQSLTQRVALLQGLDARALQHVYDERLRLNSGAETLIAGLKARGIKIALVSGGFNFFTSRLQARLGLDYTLSNTLELREGKLTGRVLGDIVGAQAKADLLTRICHELGIRHGQVIAVGDGANDLPMLSRAGLSVAYHAKPKVQSQADVVFNYCGLDGILALLGS